ncbi:MAG: oligosaccharide flippase family protein [Pirellulaceae bacterium]|nr:oligosaccharide flippase family protein [Pirellulaceae bacterium]
MHESNDSTNNKPARGRGGRTWTRVASNYLRLLTTFIIGLVVVRLQLRLGEDAFAFITLMLSNIGIALLLKEVVRAGVIPALGAAYHDDAHDNFRSVFNSALVVSFVVGIATAVLFLSSMAFIPFLSIPEELHGAARYFIAVSAVGAFTTIVLSPVFHLYVVAERMIAYNVWLMLDRAGDLLAVIITICIAWNGSASQPIVCYVTLATASEVILGVVSAYFALRATPRAQIALRTSSRKSITEFTRSAAWIVVTTVAMNLYTRVDTLLMNLYFGLPGTLVFGLATQATYYIRQLVMGVVSGVDAVSARVAKRESHANMLQLIRNSTSLQAIVIFPMMFSLMIFAEDLVALWVGSRLDDPDKTIPTIATMIRVLTVGVASRSLSEGWMSILNGAGKVDRYARFIIVGGVLNASVALGVLLMFDTDTLFYAPAWICSIVLFAVHLVVIPVVVAREYKESVWSIVSPLVLPFIASLVCCVAAAGVSRLVQSGLPQIVLYAGTLILIYGISVYALVMSRQERSKIHNVLTHALRLR